MHFICCLPIESMDRFFSCLFCHPRDELLFNEMAFQASFPLGITCSGIIDQIEILFLVCFGYSKKFIQLRTIEYEKAIFMCMFSYWHTMIFDNQ
ncbi:hypothetical protein RB25_24255 [Herbaspirillum rubrisubalbicans]|nr:hypothetical protein RB25_24255 [Herbaspirillum rubrisubalbicans]